MRYPRCCVVIFLVSQVSFASAQDARNADQTKNDWNQVTALAESIPAKEPKDVRLKTAALIKDTRSQFRQLAKAAKNFYQSHPDDLNSVKARKLEALASLEGAADGTAATKKEALAIAHAFRTSPNHPASDRFEVALAMEKFQSADKLPEGRFAADPNESQRIANLLHFEFGDTPEVYGIYAGIIRTCDMETASRVAQRLVDMPAPEFAKAEARDELKRYSLVGKPLALQLSTIDGAAFDVAKQANGVTVLWLSTDPQLFDRHPNQALKGVRWVYVLLGAPVADAKAKKPKPRADEVYCVEPAGLKSNAANLLKIRHTPHVFVLNSRGALAGYGRVDELPALLERAGAGKGK